MDAQFVRLLEVLDQARSLTVDDLPAFLQSLPCVGALPSPWETWTLIGLVRHRERQYWVRHVIQNCLNGDCAAIGAMGALGHPESVAQSGTVPGLPEWEYYFHGRGCCLTHKVTGEEIDVDFWDDTAEHFCIYFYEIYLQSLRNPEPPEQRLLELHRSTNPISIAVNRLHTAGAMTPKTDGDLHPLRIADGILTAEDAIDAFCRAWGDSGKRVWLASLIGDWLAAHNAASDRPEVWQITGPRVEQCEAIRRELLLQVSGHHEADALRGLAELGGADKQIVAAFRGPPSGVISAALDIIGQQDDPKWYPDIYSMFKRMNPDGQLPEPRIWITSLKYLLRHGYRKDEMIAALAKANGLAIGEAVLLALQYAPSHALPLIRRGLLSNIPCNRTTVAAVLALIAKPWSIRELLSALEASTGQEQTADARAALLEMDVPGAEKEVRAWEEMNPHEDEAGEYFEFNGRTFGPCYSIDESALKARASYIRYEMNVLTDRVMKIKDVVPPEPHKPKPRWRFWRNSQ